MFRRVLVVLVAAVAFAPAVASATTAVPALHSGDTQAYLLDSYGNPITSTTTVTMSGSVSFDTAYGFSCQLHLTIDVLADGTVLIKNPHSLSACTVIVPSCNVSPVANVSLGSRFVLDGSGDYRARINFSLTNTFSGAGCPFGPITYAGEWSPVLTFGGWGGLEATFNSTSGTLASSLGPMGSTGTVTEQGTIGNYGLGI